MELIKDITPSQPLKYQFVERCFTCSFKQQSPTTMSYSFFDSTAEISLHDQNRLFFYTDNDTLKATACLPGPGIYWLGLYFQQKDGSIERQAKFEYMIETSIGFPSASKAFAWFITDGLQRNDESLLKHFFYADKYKMDNANGNIPLHYAALRGERDTIKWLIESGSSSTHLCKDAQNHQGLTPLMLACRLSPQ